MAVACTLGDAQPLASMEADSSSALGSLSPTRVFFLRYMSVGSISACVTVCVMGAEPALTLPCVGVGSKTRVGELTCILMSGGEAVLCTGTEHTQQQIMLLLNMVLQLCNFWLKTYLTEMALVHSFVTNL